MKKIISVELKTSKVDFIKCKTDLLCVGVFSEEKKLDKITSQLNKKLASAIEKLLSIGDFKAKASTTAIVYGNEKINAKRILLVGLGKKTDLDLDTIRKAAASAASKAVELKAKDATVAIHQGAGKLGLEKAGQAIAEGLYCGSYQYDEYITDNEDPRLGSLKIVIADSDADNVTRLKKAVKTGAIIGQAQSFARTIANRPGNVINPVSLAAQAKKLAKETANLTCTVFDAKELKQKKMGGILAVGAGSKTEPRLIILKYNAPNKKAKTIALVGKAITFDSGGISIKPSNGMQDMKLDKSGGIAVLGTMKAIAQLKPSVNVYGIIPAAENMPGGSSYRPGDIVTTFSGKTVEVQNTDVEGRMILCDAIHYAVTKKCDAIVDIATLTGACMVALGKHKAGLMSNNDKMIKQLEDASKASGEKLWHLPCGEEYTKEMKSKIADLKNIGSRWGGASTAASFLCEFTSDTDWAHIDMAGVDMFEGDANGAAGATGFGVRLLTSYLMNQKK